MPLVRVTVLSVAARFLALAVPCGAMLSLCYAVTYLARQCPSEVVHCLSLASHGIGMLCLRSGSPWLAVPQLGNALLCSAVAQLNYASASISSHVKRP